MKSFVAILALVALAVADVSHLKTGDAAAETLEQRSEISEDKFQNSYKTSNGIAGEESGVVVNAGREDAFIQTEGFSSYTSPEGVPIFIKYIANENGYQPQGDHLPTPPPPQPIPDYILRSIEYNKAHPYKETNQ